MYHFQITAKNMVSGIRGSKPIGVQSLDHYLFTNKAKAIISIGSIKPEIFP